MLPPADSCHLLISSVPGILLFLCVIFMFLLHLYIYIFTFYTLLCLILTMKWVLLLFHKEEKEMLKRIGDVIRIAQPVNAGKQLIMILITC